ncbi:Pimeloyl-ACP methyl ester carboxylesterase [Mucilaginibacter pineti]|uniref:Pimeloyl-ACP methyl ester carboxylesterase n=1 Tax=Mucilaginibacter pineti TaxID=1391627 RepID=A0A1G6XC55_9SPHI|nr:alpha/beta hydrolase [Mucilaginibacter pineti]SDD75652.1 Pimeloyl-ACP methyl ester carboxylesterase [Mucilaginibacter pineti]
MQQKFITIGPLKLAYFEKNHQSKKTIFFIHGNSVSSRSWQKQLDSDLLNNYRLIAIDLPGHGGSDISQTPAADYTFHGLGSLMASAIKILAGEHPYLLAGLSLGTNILAEALAYDLNPAGIVLASSCVAGNNITVQDFVLPDTHVFVVFTGQAADVDVRKYAAEVLYNDNEIDANVFVEDYYRTDPQFRSVLANNIAAQNFSDEIALLQHTKKPLLLIFGKNEEIVNPDYLDGAQLNLWKNEIFKITNAGHLVNIDSPENFNTLLAAYAGDCFNLSEV